MDEYNNKFGELIDNYKNEILTINDSYQKLNEYFIGVSRIVQTNINASPNRNLLLSTSFFNKSALTQLLKFESYKPTNNGNLITSSANCRYTISEVKMEGETEKEKLFIKVVSYNSQDINHTIDLIIFDVINSIIFEKLLLLPENQIYRNYIPKYKGSFVSYIKNNWNYNELIYKDSLSPYNYDNINSGRSPYYREKGIVYLSESIDIISVSSVFKRYDYDPSSENKNRMIDVLFKTAELYEFIKYLGNEYGFMHNDLHMENVVYDITKKRLLLIDFGRVSFKKFISTVDPEYRDCLMSEYNKLNYNELLKGIRINNYTELFTDKKMFVDTIAIESDGNYFGVIYDLMTFTLNIYVRTLFFMNRLHRTKYDSILAMFNKILKLNFRHVDDLLLHEVGLSSPITIEELVKNYVSVKNDNISLIADEDTKKLFMFLSEGLFYMALYLHFIRNGSNIDVFRQNDDIFFHFHILKSDNLQQFKDFIGDKLKPYKSELMIDSFISRFIPSSGGLINFSKTHHKDIYETSKNKKNEFKLFSKKEMKSASKSISKKLSLEETTKLYKEYFDNKNTNSFDYRQYKPFYNLPLPSPKSIKSKSLSK